VEILGETGTVFGGNGKEKDDDDYNLPTIEELLYTTLQKKGFAMEDPSPDSTVQGVEEVALDERGGSINHSRSTPGDSSGNSQGERACYLLLWNRP
jgi:hypothetical protein